MERRFPLIDIGVEVAERLLRPLSSTARPYALELLPGGHINSNYVVSFDDGQRVVLRICAHGEDIYRKEIKLLRALYGSVPVPRIYMTVYDPQIFEYPYTVLEWIEGKPLNEVLLSFPEAAPEIGEAVGAVLLKMRAHVLPEHTYVSFVEYIRECLYELGAANYLSTETAARLWTLVQQQGHFLDELCQVEGLVHGDFQGDNILIQEQAGHWKVAAVLDWEWARNGCYLTDLGCLLRFQGEASMAFEHGIEAVFSRLAAPLPFEWKKAGRILDLAAHCEKLGYPRHRGEVTLKSIRIIERCLQDYCD